jgi:mRNA interferase MazF
LSLSRGDVVIVAAAGDYGKPRPAVVVQTDAIPAAHPSVVVCQMTSTLVDASDLRVTIEPSPENGLRELSQVMIDKPVTLMRSRISGSIGRLSVSEMARVTAGLAFVIGVAD